MRCPSCDTPNPPEATRCTECGAALKARPVRRPESEAIEERPSRRRPDDEPREAPRARRRRRDDDDDDDYEDDRPRRRRRADDEDETVAAIIPYKNPKALTAYYLGVFSLIPILGVVLAPFALVLGILGLRYARRNRRAHGTGHGITGIVLGAISLLIWQPVSFFLILPLLLTALRG